MKIAILGATGMCGTEITDQALKAGHEVIAVVRTPGKMKVEHENLKVVTGNIFSADTMKEPFTGCDAVVSCLGKYSFRSFTLYSNSIKCITEAMNQAQVSRLVVMSGWNCKADPNNPGSFVIEKMLMPMFFSEFNKDLVRMEDYLQESCPDINFTVLRCPGITSGRRTGKMVKVAEGMSFVPGVSIFSAYMSKHDLMEFMLRCVTEDMYGGKSLQ